MPSVLVVLSFLLLHAGVQGFGILPGKSLNHLEITEEAILNTVLKVCRSLAANAGTAFTSPAEPFDTVNIATACGTPESSKSFRQAILSITLRNAQVDLRHALNASFHFDDEMFIQGKGIIIGGLQAVKASNQKDNFESARQNLGMILHPLQDFYSHSNWVEMGNEQPNSNLIKSTASIGNIAAKNRATCRNCDGDDCTNNILEDIIQDRLLTSGYFGVVPLLSTKPEGKCSHGGAVDQTSDIEPKGGINKDSSSSSHGHLHRQAADMAVAATSELLEDIGAAAGDEKFLRMIGIFRGSTKALCFAIDTTGSMRDDIEVVKNVTASIISSEVGTANEPSVYILVPFNDPDFGPPVRTTDPEVFRGVINSLSASGGGDEGELSLSGLQLALTSAPSNSEIFLFTDAPAKDANLKSTVIALIERTQTVVNFFISGSSSINRRRLRSQQSNRITESDAEVYRDVAQPSGGLTIEVTKNELPEAVSIITESSSSSLVTLVQAARNPGMADSFNFLVDETVTNPRIYITGRSFTFTLTSPSGESQQSDDTTGPLIASSKLVGNLMTVRLNTQNGQWKIDMVSNNPYTLKVIGQSSIDFFFEFVVASQGTFQGFDVLEARLNTGVTGRLLVTLTGSGASVVTEVALVEFSGAGEVKGAVEPQGTGTYLVAFDSVPSFNFVVRVKGRRDTEGGGQRVVFQRQTATNFKSSNLTVTADSDGILVAGSASPVPFSVMTSAIEGNFTIRATNNLGFDSTFPASLFVEVGNGANGTVTLSAPPNTPSGTDVILTIEAEAPGVVDTNYVVLRFTVINPETDFTPPVCELQSLQSNCSENCSLSTTWELSALVTDGGGVASVTLKAGSGTVRVRPDGQNGMLVSYSASCCSPDMELQVVDNVGNIGSCFFTVRDTPPEALSSSAKVTQSPLLFLSVLVLGLQQSFLSSDSMFQ